MKTDRNILVAFILNIGFSIFELIGGILTGSIAILSDSLHDIGDALSIGLSYFLERKSKKKADSKHTYGYVRYSVMGSVITTMILLVGSIFVIVEAIKRFINPVDINYNGMIIFAIFGVIVNSLATYFTREGDSLNQKSVNLHMLEDVLGWIVVLIGSILMKFTDITYIDSILSIGVAIFIFINAMRNLKEIIDLFLEVTPSNVDIEEIKKHLLEVDGVNDVHHIHVRSIDGYNNFATLHVVVDKYSEKIKHDVKEELEEHGICHSTIELELNNEKCDEIDCEIKGEVHHHHHHH
jgi:cobalt-zinc-cadmium efflux system protein